MRIAQVAPLFESVPPRLYGGTERGGDYLTEELVRQGHRVTLFASGDSITSAELVPCTPRALRLDPDVRDSGIPFPTRCCCSTRFASVLEISTSCTSMSTICISRCSERKLDARSRHCTAGRI